MSVTALIMHTSEAGDNLPRHELHALQKALRVRASNLKKTGKRQGLIRPLSKDDIGQLEQYTRASAAVTNRQALECCCR